MKLTIAVAALFVSASSALACPDYTLWGNETYEVTGDQLYTPRSFSVVAGGDTNLERCRIRSPTWNGAMPGFVISKPDFSITVRGVAGYELEFRTVSSCDTVLLINTAGANWYFDDDDNGNADAKIRLTRPSGDGIYDVWIGTYNGDYCDAQLIVETF
ncbi:hypothetical protein [Roseicitreum antarcticum]|uniref:Non-specific serine/threonine protein kinase n=1 Tax=Roseicitreum antarcticum TaxID=564137 RepID=A0A1H2VVQ0_9RHOB|nr:hypothetical protein [Roseicitreum antarcticum]SDW72363.1 non-specific serine/threonine protein kinase [Roseicitreum antarcticum]